MAAEVGAEDNVELGKHFVEPLHFSTRMLSLLRFPSIETRPALLSRSRGVRLIVENIPSVFVYGRHLYRVLQGEDWNNHRPLASMLRFHYY